MVKKIQRFITYITTITVTQTFFYLSCSELSYEFIAHISATRVQHKMDKTERN